MLEYDGFDTIIKDIIEKLLVAKKQNLKKDEFVRIFFERNIYIFTGMSMINFNA